jgi:hypothetical protein
MTMIALNTTADINIEGISGMASPCDAFFRKNGGGAWVNLGAIATQTGGTTAYPLFTVPVPLSQTDTLGELGVAIYDGTYLARPPAFPEIVTARPGDPGELTNAERDAVAAAILGYPSGIDTGVSLAHALMMVTAFLTGQTPMFGPITKYQNWAGTKNRITMTTDPVLGRISVVFDFS